MIDPHIQDYKLSYFSIGRPVLKNSDNVGKNATIDLYKQSFLGRTPANV